ncbi:MAG: DUF6285 domain-containing protein [Candidatus Hydrogenedentota bacterium]
MPTDRPTATELLTAVREHLINNVAPTLEGQPAFHMRVATNALAIVERTMEHGATMDKAEHERLQALLSKKGNLIELNQSLVEKIRAGKLIDKHKDVLSHLRQTVIDKVQLANPKYLTPRD